MSVLVVAQPSSEVPEGTMNYPVLEDLRTFMVISRSVLHRIRNVSDKSCTEK